MIHGDLLELVRSPDDPVPVERRAAETFSEDHVDKAPVRPHLRQVLGPVQDVSVGEGLKPVEIALEHDPRPMEPAKDVVLIPWEIRWDIPELQSPSGEVSGRLDVLVRMFGREVYVLIPRPLEVTDGGYP